MIVYHVTTHKKLTKAIREALVKLTHEESCKVADIILKAFQDTFGQEYKPKEEEPKDGCLPCDYPQETD